MPRPPARQVSIQIDRDKFVWRSTRLLSLLERSDRKRDILQLLASGSREADIATALGIAKTTVHSHVLSIYGALEIDDRLHLGILIGLMSEE